MRRELERIEVPGAAAAEERAALVVAAGFDERRPPPPARRTPRGPLVAVVVAAAIVAAVLSPPGRAVVDHVRRTVGIDHSRAALFSLPTQGRLLVASGSGVWVVQPDGSRRLIGGYDEASWSPLGRFVVAARRNELAALDADGSVRWTLARHLVQFPRWSGSATDTRIAYLSGDRLHVVAGDGRSDADIGGRPVAAVAPGWRRGPGFVLAYADLGGQITSLLTGKGGALWTTTAPGSQGSPRSLEWSSDGSQLLVLSERRISVLDAGSGRTLSSRPEPGALAVAYRPGTHAVAVLRRASGGSQVVLGTRVLFSFAGALRGLTWSPDGRWLLVGSPASDQWVFIRADGRKIVAVSNVSGQFRSRSFPRVEGWCCTP